MSRIKDIKARVAAATDGPWVEYTPEDGVRPRTFIARKLYVDVPPKFYIAFLRDMDQGDAKPDAAFIAHARTDIPDLLRVVEAAADLAGRYPAMAWTDLRAALADLDR